MLQFDSFIDECVPTVSYSYQLKERTTNICLCVCVCVCFIQRIKRIVWSLVDTLHVLICKLALVACVCFLFYYFMDIWLLCDTIIDMQANAVEITVLFTRTTITNARAHIRCRSTTGCCNGLIFMCVVCRTMQNCSHITIFSYSIISHTTTHTVPLPRQYSNVFDQLTSPNFLDVYQRKTTADCRLLFFILFFWSYLHIRYIDLLSVCLVVIVRHDTIYAFIKWQWTRAVCRQINLLLFFSYNINTGEEMCDEVDFWFQLDNIIFVFFFFLFHSNWR